MLPLVLTCCAPVYVPNVRNSPLFTGGGEFQSSFQFGNGLDVQAAGSVIDHLGLMANYSYASRRNNYEDTNDYHSHNFWEGAVGYFQNDGSSCFEVFAGYGRGEGTSFDNYFFSSGKLRTTGKFERYFIQPAFGLNKKMMHVSFISRITMVDFYEFTDEYTPSFVPDADPSVFVEPAVMGRINVMDNHLFFTFQAGAAFPLVDNVYFNYRPFQISTGMGFRIGGKSKDKKVEE